MEYNNIRGNIYQEEFNKRANGIVSWIRENRGTEEWTLDPNAFEMTNVFLLGAKYASEGVDVDKETLKEMWEIRAGDFERCGVSNNNFVYKICEDSYQASQRGRALVNDEGSHTALTEMADIGLFLSRQKARGENIEFDNPNQLMALLEGSRTLKGVHPELFERYGFKENLQTIARLQLEKQSDLSDRIQGKMNEIFGESTIEKGTQEVKIKERE